ncbi:hypothetical protein TRFO_21715 [Tritrichomonas foetus]|uniref:Uncharacterized protein n=1 Tax=Tritrichomonas foetus TaxID=1144522 RepID=A0A1J4KEN5_9EUKA|nr:hypothetical protein TRFO_21715 [Tritrichomonas foetus]|eukprot:OHT09392.1 hypothetical protein TRFO_21715 [Tritrichomonas foetus]
MEEKKTPPNLGEDTSYIEADFNLIFQQLDGLSYAGKYESIFKNLKSLLIDSHQKNQKLAKTVQFMNQKVIDNATSVQSLLKMSENDTIEIDRYKLEFEKVLSLVSVSQNKEVRAKELCDSLKEKINKLTKVVSEQSVNEDTATQLKLDLLNYQNETKMRQKEMDQLVSDSKNFQHHIEEEIENKENAIITAQNLEDAIRDSDQQYQLIIQSKEQYTQEIGVAKDENTNFTDNADQNVQEISKLKKHLWKLRQTLQHQRSMENEYKVEYENTSHSLQNKIYKKEQITNKNAEIEKKIKYANIRMERSQQEIDNLNAQLKHINHTIENHQKELEEITQKSDIYHQEISELTKKKREYGHTLFEVGRKVTFTEATNLSNTREADSKSRVLQNMSIVVDEAKAVANQAAGLTKLVKSHIATTKKGIQKQDFKSTNLEKEILIFVEKSNGIKVQLLRYEDNANLLQIEIDNAEQLLSHLTKSLDDNEVLNRQTQIERDLIANKITGVEKDNERLEQLVIEKTKAVEDLRKKIDQRTEDIINVHFQTRGLEKQIQSIGSILNITKGLCQQANTTIVGYKAEGQKLRLILDETQKDIKAATAEITNIRSMTNLLRRQVNEKTGSADNESRNVQTLINQLRIKQSAAKQQAEETYVLTQELDKAIAKHDALTKRATMTAKLEVIQIRLAAQLRREQEFCNACVIEFSHPLNVHRYQMMKMMQPDQYKSIQLISYLKTKIEEVKREQIKLDNQKQKLIKKIQANKSNIKSVKITNGENAINVYKNAIAKKEMQLDEMKKEIDQVIQERQEVIETISMLRNKLKQSHITTTNLKKQNQQYLQVPKLHIVTGLDKTRLGGGFSITPDSKQKVQTARFFLTEAKTDENEPISSRDSTPSTTRTKTSSQLSSRKQNSSRINNIVNKTQTPNTSRKPKTNSVLSRPTSTIAYTPNKETEITTSLVKTAEKLSMIEFTPKMKKQKPRSELDKPVKKKTIRTGKTQVKRNDEAKTPRIEFHNSQLSARRSKDETNTQSRPTSRVPEVAIPKNNWKPQSVIKPTVGPYFGPI